MEPKDAKNKKIHEEMHTVLYESLVASGIISNQYQPDKYAELSQGAKYAFKEAYSDTINAVMRLGVTWFIAGIHAGDAFAMSLMTEPGASKDLSLEIAKFFEFYPQQ